MQRAFLLLRGQRFKAALLIYLTCFLLITHALVGERQLIEVHRIVTVGDVHGDVENFLKILYAADLLEGSPNQKNDPITDPPKWKFLSAPNASVKVHTTLVQMGDLVDRGEQDLESLNVAISLQEQTQKSPNGDKVVLLIGNHELLNLQGYYHYVNKRNYGGFRSKPLRVEAMQPDGAFGKYILDHFKVAHLDESTLFVHAGLEAASGVVDIDALNADVLEALRARNYRHRHLHSNGPLWTRKMITDSMTDKCDEVEDVLSKIGATRIVVGHTPQRSGQIEQYCDGRVVAADVGISRWMFNNVAAVEMVFMKYIDPATQSVSTTFSIRELREGSSTFTIPGVPLVRFRSAPSTDNSAFDDDDGDL